MKVIGIKTVKRSKLTLPGNWKEILARPSAAERGRSHEEMGGYLHEPIVRKVDGKLVLLAGRDRVAGTELQGLEEVTVKVVECDDAEAASIEEVENIERRHDPKEKNDLIAQRIRRLAEMLEPDPPGKKPGRPKGAKRKALEQVAAERGVKPRSVEQAERRRRKKEEARLAGMLGDVTDPDEPCIRLVGVDVDEGDLKDIAKIQGFIDDSDKYLRQAARCLGELAAADLPFPESVLDRLREQVKEAGRVVRAVRPTVLCPWCKMVEGVVENCAACHTMGWVGPQEKGAVPEELWDEEHPRVILAGETRYVADLFEDDGEEEEVEELFG